MYDDSVKECFYNYEGQQTSSVLYKQWETEKKLRYLSFDTNLHYWKGAAHIILSFYLSQSTIFSIEKVD